MNRGTLKIDAVTLCFFLLLSLPLFARENTDVIIMKNGDHLTGEIKGLNGGVLYVGLPYVIQTLSVDWSKVDHLESKQMFPHISDLNSVVESSDRRFHQYPCGFESDDYAPEVNTQWVKAPNSL